MDTNDTLTIFVGSVVINAALEFHHSPDNLSQLIAILESI